METLPPPPLLRINQSINIDSTSIRRKRTFCNCNARFTTVH